MYVLKIMDKLNEWSESLKEFMLKNDGNIVLFVALFLGGVAIFSITYNALHKGD